MSTAAVLYDVPGPRARRRNLGVGVLGTLVLLAAVGFVVYRFAATGQFSGRSWEWIQYVNIQRILLGALGATLAAFAVAAVLSLTYGGLFAVARLSDHRWLARSATGFVEFFRAVPLLVLIFTLYFGVSRGLGVQVSTFWSLVIGLTLYNGSIQAEVLRAGVTSLPRGQGEAAYALGLRKTQVMTTVLLPQAVRSMLPTIVSQLVVTLKDTALGFLILYPELLYQARFLGSQGQLGLPIVPVALVVAVIYLTLCVLLSAPAGWLARRAGRGSRRPGGEPATIAGAEGAVLAAESESRSGL